MSSSIHDSHGNLVQLGDAIGRGGEGQVFRITGRPDVVAKLFHRGVSQEKQTKLEAMLKCATADLYKLTCWPCELLRNKEHRVVGYVMPYASGYQDIHKLYNPRSRSKYFPDCDWGFIVRSAANMARAFAMIHSYGHVVGDVNHSSVFVSSKATVRLIDCDSFQIQHSGRVYLCPVAEPLHTAPELYGKDLASLARTPNHDNFGLAVLIFELLFMGRHPFAGHFAGSELSLQDKMERYLFCYGAEAAKRGLSKPVLSLSMSSLTPEVAKLFEDAFRVGSDRDDARPTASAWALTLSDLEAMLDRCKTVASHRFVKGLRSCPWCELEKASLVSYFGMGPVLGRRQVDSVDLDVLRASVERASALSGLSVPKYRSIKPSVARPELIEIGRRRRVLTAFVWAMALILALLFEPGVSGAIIGASVGGCSALLMYFVVGHSERKECKRVLSLLRAEYVKYVTEWEKGTSMLSVEREVAAFRKCLDAINDIQHKVVKDREQLIHQERERQQSLFLMSHKLVAGVVPGIGHGRCFELKSNGIVTAYDVKRDRIESIHGFGWSLSSALVSWRQEVERRFVFDPTRISAELRRIEEVAYRTREGLLADARKMASRVEGQRMSIEAAHTSGKQKLEGLSNQVASTLADIRAL